VNAARAGAQLRVVAHSVVGYLARARGGVQVNIRRRLNLVIDADVVHVFVVAANFYNAACLLDGRVGRNLPNLILTPAPVGPYLREDMDLSGGALRQVDVSRAILHRQFRCAFDLQVALEGRLRCQRRKGCQHQCGCCEKNPFHSVPLFLENSGQWTVDSEQ